MLDSTNVAEKPLGYQQVTGIDAAVTLKSKLTPASIPPGTSVIVIIPEAQAIRWRDDAVAPTAAVGQPLAVGVELRYSCRAMDQLQVISQAAGAILNCVFYGSGV